MTLPDRTEVLVAGGGPVGLAAAVELGSRGVDCVVVEPRPAVSHARPRCKTVNVRTMEHLRRWGIAEEFRSLAPLPVSWSSDVVFCTSLAGRELSRFTGVLGLDPGDRSAEPGQQAPQYVLEELLRDVVAGLPTGRLVTGSVAGVAQDDHEARVSVVLDGREQVVRADYVLGCDGPRSTVRDAIGSAYVGGIALRPNFGMVFRAPRLRDSVRHGPAVQYWTVNADAPALMGPIDRDATWWIIAFGVEEADGRARGREIIDAAAGVRTDAEILSTDPWTARMMLVDRARSGRVFLAGDAAHLNPPFGGHGLNTGVGDAVDLGWKLAAVLRGWGGPGLLDSYEAERRPVQDRVIREAESNMRTLSADLVVDDVDRDGPVGDAARRTAHDRIQATKHAEFHALDLVLDVSYPDSPIVDGGGARLQHRWLDDGRALHDLLGPGFTLLTPGDPAPSMVDAADAAGVPLAVRRSPLDRYVLVRPDQHVAWQGDELPSDPHALLDRVRGAAPAFAGQKEET
ncbi:FAD-dependent monooxygenase [Pseudonocardia endophytica]|uniref:2-polyprenyl-6-methoxyphenol hydroxylase-like FAD-dependent oxidoreductase n=1 Tax=Pseudonocardia endophytica TaxID=401976 RepID=A0A4R1HP26_PSEEN|nr:FAD-dependent monooxygenase [Pseudonocardia endophytica]TCK21469.1 2-polyprenyl-6-methoxyphenol hydroxylase-like FAD-dependent oxidoreductase [Pseudonocardia endophytica]